MNVWFFRVMVVDFYVIRSPLLLCGIYFCSIIIRVSKIVHLLFTFFFFSITHDILAFLLFSLFSMPEPSAYMLFLLLRKDQWVVR